MLDVLIQTYCSLYRESIITVSANSNGIDINVIDPVNGNVIFTHHLEPNQ